MDTKKTLYTGDPYQYTKRLRIIDIIPQYDYYDRILAEEEDGYPHKLLNPFKYPLELNKTYFIQYEQTSAHRTLFYSEGEFHYHKSTDKWILQAVEYEDG